MTRRRDVKRDRRGFTLIEILTAVAIIAALIAMFFIGFRYVKQRAQQDQTKVAVQTLRNMLTEFEVQGAAMRKLDDIYAGLDPLPAPGMVTENSTDRTGEAVKRTRLVMKRLLAIPANRKLLAEMPGSTPNSSDPTKIESDLIWRTVDGSGQEEIIFLDSHRNPIVYVPKSGMSGVTQGGKTLTITTPGARDVKQPDNSIKFQGTGFFAAAGVDGNFQAGDDNVYSFQ
jgi:prepilin-type N-terminal cleavage/methylation domain-containing protein